MRIFGITIRLSHIIPPMSFLLIHILLLSCTPSTPIPTALPIQNVKTATPYDLPTKTPKTPTATIAPSPTQPWLPQLEVLSIENVQNLIELQDLAAYSPALAVSPNGTWLASGSLERKLQIWNLSDGHLTSIETETDPGQIWALSFSKDGSVLAMGSGDSLIRIWQIPEGVLLNTFEGHINEVRCLDFSPNGLHLVSGSHDQMIRLWQVAEGRMLKILGWNPGFVRAVSFSPDGSLIASVSGKGTLRLWDADGQLLGERILQDADLTSVAISPDGAWLAVGGQNRFLWLFSIPDLRRLDYIEAHSDDINSLAFSPDGTLLASGSEDGSIRIWKVEPQMDLKLTQIQSLIPRPGYRVSKLLFTPDGKMLVSASLNDEIILWGVPAD